MLQPMRVRTMLIVLSALLLGGLALQPGRSAAQDKDAGLPFEPRALARALQGGGYVIYLRHATTDHSQVDADRIELQNCRTQRNLSEKGKEQARSIGKAFQKLDIKVAEVLSSP